MVRLGRSRLVAAQPAAARRCIAGPPRSRRAPRRARRRPPPRNRESAVTGSNWSSARSWADGIGARVRGAQASGGDARGRPAPAHCTRRCTPQPRRVVRRDRDRQPAGDRRFARQRPRHRLLGHRVGAPADQVGAHFGKGRDQIGISQRDQDRRARRGRWNRSDSIIGSGKPDRSPRGHRLIGRPRTASPALRAIATAAES